MEKFLSVNDVQDVNEIVESALKIKANPEAYGDVGKNKMLGLLFFNPSLRTRLSTQRAARHLGMDVMVMNIDKDGWKIETEEGVIMDSDKAEHLKDAAAVISQYCDIIGVRSFPNLQNKEEDYSDSIMKDFVKYAKSPIVSLESATRHPLQSLADLVTIRENSDKPKKKVVLTWAPHPRALPQAVPNSFAEWMNAADDVELVITAPEGYELDPEFVGEATFTTNQDEALKGADFVYAKNWSSTKEYGKVVCKDNSWQITEEKMALTDNGKFMHCLPIRRNVVASDAVLDSENSLILEEANNRTFAAAAVLNEMLEAED
ncbi:N-acetylornithine carbamoyltransferase [Flammeovirga yaeyamensis]|uniref:N-succinylornithine carbamoyltransferase n=1 Tax=Flammeovirga yaeyamensis TaxID=367791 RepID=A0AAX1NA32_9BACT|nr:N-acetylornithine carbamoyltransferase [Flammeovirga yaeyamensis]MBB3697699.1 N-succinyl-L-ornithine transcarbamylase [Flammeovirga yaeyamensis]NMF35941.1 N-acetylornithine carbamoyltransferase [Flammeovirga yaeyamensis]QWG03110.1 N-acetylornithine carbamoyltransferase [Flammeovirga yaeyamensis]